MAQALSANTPVTVAVTANTRTRCTMPSQGHCTWLRLYSASDFYLELVDAADGGATGSSKETYKGGQAHSRQMRRGEFCLSGTASQDIETTAATKPGPG